MEHSFLVLRELRCGLGWLRVGNLNARYLSHFYHFCAEDLTDPKETNGTFTDILISQSVFSGTSMWTWMDLRQ